jgi:hypothetical protein
MDESESPSARAGRIVLRLAAVVLVHWVVGGALGLPARSMAFELLAMGCPLFAATWLAPALAPRHLADARVLVGCSALSALALVALSIAAAQTWRAHGPDGAPPFVSPLEFGARWLALF